MGKGTKWDVGKSTIGVWVKARGDSQAAWVKARGDSQVVLERSTAPMTRTFTHTSIVLLGTLGALPGFPGMSFVVGLH